MTDKQDFDTVRRTLDLAEIGMIDLSDRERERLEDRLEQLEDSIEPDKHMSPGVRWESRRPRGAESSEITEYAAHE